MKLNSHTILNKRLPSLFGFLVLFLAIGTIMWLSSNAILFGTQAATGNTPKDVTISNITDTTVTVSYTTDAAVIGTITFGSEENMNQVVLDDRDKQQKSPKEYTTHHITIENLSPSTSYAFKITSGDENFLDGEKNFQVTTRPPFTETPSEEIVTGKITLETGSPAEGAIVYISANDSQRFSTLVTNTGEYKLDINRMALTPETILQLQIRNETSQSNASVLRGQTNPVPLIILSKNYDFAVSNEPLSPSPVATDSANLTVTPETSPIAFPTVEVEAGTRPQILTPQKEQEFSDQQPLFRGKAIPNQSVTITINSEQTITTSVTTDANGNWQYRPDVPLEPGNHTITIRALDASGIMRTITQQFVVYAEGSQFTEPSVSPSASSTPSPTIQQPTATPTSKPTSTPSPITSGGTITVTQTPTVTATATPTRTASASLSPTNPPLPIAGNSDMIVSILGVVTAIGIGALLFVFATL